MGRMKVAYNDDGSILAELAPDGAVQTVEALLDWTTEHVPMDLWALQTACPDVCYQRTEAGEILGQRLPPEKRSVFTRGIDLLLKQDTDLLEIYLRNLQPKGIKVLCEIRMSDTHHRRREWDDEGCPIFSIEHPEYAIQCGDRVPGMALDYAIEPVRAHRLAIIREFAERRSIDGLELNFVRWAKHFPRDWGYQHAPMMTDYVGQVRAILDAAAAQRGCARLILGARVPSTIHECFLAGCDVAAWIRRGYMDYVIPSEHNSTWPGLNVEQFAEAADGTACEVYAMMGDMIGGMWNGPPALSDRGLAQFPGRMGYGGMLNTPAEARAAAHNFYAWGAQGIGLWNIPNNCNTGYGKWGADPNQVRRMLDWIHEAIDPDRCVAGPRRYHYVPIYKYKLESERNYKYIESGRSPHGEFKGQVLYFNEGTLGKRQAYRFRMADGRDGRPLHGKLGFRIIHCGPADEVEADINGQPLPHDAVTRSYQQQDLPWTWFELDLSRCPPLRGDNELGLTWRSDPATSADVPYMEELDCTVEA